MSIELKTIIISASVSIVTAIIVAVLTHIFDKRKVKYEERIRLSNHISNEKRDGIEALRKAITKLITYERLDITEPDIIPELADKAIRCPVIFYSYKNLAEFGFELNKLHSKYSNCLNNKCNSIIIVLRNYFFECAVEVKESKLTDEAIRWLSVPIYDELRTIYFMVNKELIKMINKPTLKYYIHYGYIYEKSLVYYSKWMKSTKLYKETFGENGIFQLAKRVALNMNTDDVKELINNQ